MLGKILKLTRKHNWIQGIYKSPKSTKLHNFKSSWELGLYRILDGIKEVRCWESECIKIPYILRGKKKNYLPDVLVNNNLLIEVKPLNQIGTKMNQAKFKSAIQFCKLKGWRFKIISKNFINPFYLTEQIRLSKKR